MASLHETVDNLVSDPVILASQAPRFPSRLLRKGISYVTMSAVALPFCTMVGIVGSVSPDEVDSRPYAASTPNPGTQDVEVLSVESTTNAPGLSEKDIAKSMRRTDKLLRFGTADARGLGKISVKTIMMEPSGSALVEGVDIPCYSGDQIQTMFNKIFPDGRVKLADSNKQYMVMLENDSSCSLYEGSAAYADNIGKKAPATVYNVQSIIGPAGADGLEQAKLHELGHTWGLLHGPSIVCNTEADSFVEKPIQWQIEHGCALQRDETGKKIDEYASLSSVMGNDWKTDVSGLSLPYSFLEMSKLNPAFQVESVEPVPGVYQIAVNPGQPIGIRMGLPEDHVLGRAVKGADAIYFGLNDMGGWLKTPKKGEKISLTDPRIGYGIDALVTSRYGANITSLDTPKDNYLGSLAAARKVFKNNPNGHVVVPLPGPFYIDEQLGINVTAGINAAGYYIEVNKLK